jgi:hypothetical protein
MSRPGPFALPPDGFPIGDAKHARLAIGGATRAERAGNISVSTENRIKAEARAKLAHGRSNAAEAKHAHHPHGRAYAHGAE